MARRTTTPLLAGLALACLLPLAAATAAEPVPTERALPAEGPVSVRWGDPANFTEMRSSQARWDNTNRGDWVRRLAEHLREEATPRLAPGERLDVVIADVKRAGDYEPWRGIHLQDVRIVRDTYPPRMTLSWRRTGADGAVLDEGERRIVDGGYLTSAATLPDNDPLRFEKRLIDRWVRQSLTRQPDA